MPEVITGIEDWRVTLIEEIEALTPVAATHGQGLYPARFVEAQTPGDLLADADSLGHLLFTVEIREGDHIEMLGGSSSTAHIEQHEVYADIRLAYRIRQDDDARKTDHRAARKLARWLLHTITPGALSSGAGRMMDDAPLFETEIVNGREWLIGTISIRAHVYVDLALATVPA